MRMATNSKYGIHAAMEKRVSRAKERGLQRPPGKPKQPNEVSQFGQLPGSTHAQMNFPITDKTIDVSKLQRPDVIQSVQQIDIMKDKDILGKRKPRWNDTAIPGNLPAGCYRFPDPAMKRANSVFQSIPEYEVNYRSDYIPKFNGPVKPKASRRGYNMTDLRDDSRMLTEDLTWKNDKGEICTGCVKAQSRKKGEQPNSIKPYTKPKWDFSTEEDAIQRREADEKRRSKALENGRKKGESIKATRMGLIGRHNAVAQRIREEKTLARAEPPLPRPPTPTKAAMARTDRQTKTYHHSGVWEFNENEGCHMWSDTGSYDEHGAGDTIKVVTEGRWSFAAPS